MIEELRWNIWILAPVWVNPSGNKVRKQLLQLEYLMQYLHVRDHLFYVGIFFLSYKYG